MVLTDYGVDTRYPADLPDLSDSAGLVSWIWKDLRWPTGSDVSAGFFDGPKYLVTLPRVAPLAAQDEFCLIAFQQLALGNEMILRRPASVVIPGNASQAVRAGIGITELNIFH